jgi:hypothetical protein
MQKVYHLQFLNVIKYNKKKKLKNAHMVIIKNVTRMLSVHGVKVLPFQVHAILLKMQKVYHLQFLNVIKLKKKKKLKRQWN